MEKKQQKAMSLLEHLKELRRCFIRGFVVTLVVFLGCYFFREQLLFFLKVPLEKPLQKYSSLQTPKESLQKKNKDLENLLHCICEYPEDWKEQDIKNFDKKISLECTCNPKEQITASKKIPLVFIGLPEVFFTELKVSLFLALFFSFPYWLLEFLSFVLPALYKKEKIIFLVFLPISFLCFVGGAVFGYLVVFPIGFDFFLSLTKPQEIIPSLSIGQYTSFATKLLFVFGIIFEFPLVVLFLSRLGFITPNFMIKNAKYAIVFICIFSAILTPPDPFTMFLMAIPLTLLYFISIFLCFLTYNRRQAQLKNDGLV